jgi:hypothetical protein
MRASTRAARSTRGLKLNTDPTVQECDATMMNNGQMQGTKSETRITRILTNYKTNWYNKIITNSKA